MIKTTLGQLLINDSLPVPLRNYNRVLNKKNIKNLLREVAEDYPDQYRDISKKLLDIGKQAATATGGYSFGLDALSQSLAARRMRLSMNKQLSAIYQSDLPTKEKEKKITALASKYQNELYKEVMQESTDSQNPLALQAISGSRGNAINVNSLLGADLLYADHRGKVVPVPVLSSYAMGLKPHEYFAGAFGARKGIIDLKAATQDAGFFAKQLVQAAHRLLVSQVDKETEDDTIRGFPVDTDDIDNIGALLATPVGGYEKNTILTPKILNELKNKKINEILVRSPTVGGPEDGGVYARDVGVREKGQLAPIGDFVGITAAQALAEPVTQAQISSKHTGGIAGAAGAGAISGFKFINQLVQVPKTFQGGAAHAQLDGKVSSVEPAEQGGYYITIDGTKHYVPRDAEVNVKKGDVVEAGDVLSTGTPNPAEIVKHKGIGEGRHYFVKAFRDALQSSNTYGNRRNIELLSRGLVNHVRLTEELGDWVQDDILPYQVIENKWQPREGYRELKPSKAAGLYLEKPVLHYSIGTKLRPSVINKLNQYNVDKIYAHTEAPPFSPEMVRGMANAAHDPDWLTKMLGSYQKSSVIDAVHRGGVSNELGSSYVPALAKGDVFGRKGLTKGWNTLDLN